MKTLLYGSVICSVSLVALLPFGLSGGQLANPTITASANPYNASYSAANLFDSGDAEFATRTQGAVSAPFTTNPADGTWVEFDFGQTVTIDQFVLATRRNAADVVGVSRLIVSADAVFDNTDTIVELEPPGLNAAGYIRTINPISGRYVRWEVLTSIGTSQNLGGNQMYFLSTTAGNTRLPPPTVFNAYPAFNANYAASYAANGDAGYDAGREYASQGGGAAMFVEFDFGASVPISGFDFWNRRVDRVTTFNLVFADTADFSAPIQTLSYTADPNGQQVTAGSFEPVTARYVRFQATGNEGGANTGIREIQFNTPAGQPPVITQAPKDALRLLGDSVTFTVAASGENLDYHWWKETSAIPDATNASLVITNLQFADSGVYSVVVGSPFGSVTSEPVTLTVTNPAVDITSNLLLWFKFDETMNLVAVDESGNANDGTLQGFFGDDSQWVPGRIDNALNFNTNNGGANQVVIVQDYGLFDFAYNPEITLAAWVKGPPNQADSAGLIAKGSGAGGEQFALDIYAGAYRFFGRDESGSGVFMATATVGPNEAWQHLVGVYSRQLNRLKLYLNGEEVASSAPFSGNLLSTAHEVSIGARQSSALPDTNAYNLNFTGLMDDVRIYGRALTPADIMELYNQAPPAAPVVELQPQGIYVPVGDRWVFSFSASGSTPFYYQWTKGGTAIPDATNQTYAVTNAQASDTGDYAVVVTNAHGKATSDSARLTVVPSLDLGTAPVQASSEWPGGAYAPAHAFDGLRFSTGPATARWASASQGIPQWIYVDLGRDMRLEHVLLDWEYAVARDMKLRARTATEGPSTNPDEWREIAAVTGYIPVGNGVDGADMVFDFAQAKVVLQGNTSPDAFSTILSEAVTARYLMVHALALTAPHGHVSLWEMNVNTKVGPALTIERSGPDVVISWPADITGFELEEADMMPADAWYPVSGVVNNRVTVPADGTKFYRLRGQ